MASTEELVEAIYRLIASSPTPNRHVDNHGVDETAAIMGAVVERCARDNIALTDQATAQSCSTAATTGRARSLFAAAEAVSRSGGPMAFIGLKIG